MLGSCLPLILVVGLGVITVSSVKSLLQSNGWVDHTHEVIASAEKILAAAVDMETGVRGYLLAGEEQFLDPYKGGQVTFVETLTALQATVSDNPAQVELLNEINTTIEEWKLNAVEPAIVLRHDIGDAKTMDDMADKVGQAKGKVFFDKFREQIALFMSREQKLMDERKAAAETATAENLALNQLIEDTTGWVAHTVKVIATANEIIAAGVDMETGMRGYLLAGEEAFLEPYNGGQKRFQALVASLSETVSDNAAQVKLLTEIKTNINAWVTDVTEPAIALRRGMAEGTNTKTTNDVAALVAQGKGKAYFDKFRGQVVTFIGREQKLMDERKQSAIDATVSRNEKSALITQTTGWVAHTYDVLAEANKVLAAAVDMETGMRGFLLSGKEGFLDPYNGGKALFYGTVASLSETVSDNDAQVQLLGEINTTITNWQSNVTEPIITLRREIGDAMTMNDMAALIREAKGKVYFDSFREQIATFEGREQALMDQRKAEADTTANSTITAIVVGSALTVLGVIVISFLVSSLVVKPLVKMVDALRDIAEGEGDLTQRIESKSTDELGDLAKWFNTFVEKIQGVVQSISKNTKVLTGATNEIGGVANSMVDDTQTLTDQASTVAAATEEMSINMDCMAKSTTGMSNTVQSVSAAAEQMSSALKEVAKNTEDANTIVGEANVLAQKSNQEIGELGSAAQEIGKVVDVIQDIAEQTNLLALNATIEAARAGEAGKGFAVVANEVKELARQTGEATEDISKRIGLIQTSTGNAVESIQAVGDVIEKVNEVSKTISASVEEQSVTTGQITSSMKEASAASQQISSTVSETAAATNEINQSIISVDQISKDTGKGASTTQQAATKLHDLASELDSLVSTFKI